MFITPKHLQLHCRQMTAGGQKSFLGFVWFLVKVPLAKKENGKWINISSGFVRGFMMTRKLVKSMRKPPEHCKNNIGLRMIKGKNTVA